MSSVTNTTGTNLASTATGAASSGSAAAAATSSTGSAQTTLNTDTQNFYKLLTTQLQNQDPTSPADTNQITSEIAQLNEVQQQIDTNTNLQQLISLFSATQVGNAVSYIGKQVDATGNQTQLSSNGVANLAYNLPSGASSATVNITNSSGQTVFSGPGTTVAGRNAVTWNGLNSTTGSAMPAGAYTFSVTAKDANGKALTPTTYTTGVVTAVNTQSGTNTLSLDSGLSVPLSNVQDIANPTTTTASTTTNTNS